MRNLLIITALLGVFAFACDSSGKEARTSQGYRYTLHTDGASPKATAGDFVTFAVYVRKQDSVLFSTRMGGESPVIQIADPAADPLRTLDPVEDILTVLGVGDSATVVMELDTLPQKPPGFEDVSELLYDVVVEKIESEEEYMSAQEELKREALAARKTAIRSSGELGTLALEQIESIQERNLSGELGDEVQTTESGLRYVVHEAGTGEQAASGKTVSVNYLGMTAADGDIFDESFTRGEPITFPLGQGRVIAGWDEGLALLKAGAKATLLIPGDLAYGPNGRPPSIPPNAELLFFVELVDVQDAPQ